MALLHHDTTGTQTDCPRPLSRKKLKKIMPQGHTVAASRTLLKGVKIPSGKKCWGIAIQKHEQRRKKFGKKLLRAERLSARKERTLS